MTAAFHLSKKEAQRELNVLIALDFYHFVQFHLFCEKSLTFRHHLVEQKTILAHQTAEATYRLRFGCWSLRTAALSMVYLTAEYWAPIWCRCALYCFIDSVLYDALRSVTGCLRLTPIDHQPILSGIQPAELCRLGATLSLTNDATLDPDRIINS